MKTTLSAHKVWLMVVVMAFFFGCAKKGDDGNNNNGFNNGYPYGGYPGGYNSGGSTGGTVPAGGLVKSAAGLVHIDGENLNVDFELFFRAGPGGASAYNLGNLTVDGRVRMNQADPICFIQGPVDGVVEPSMSTVTLSGSENFQLVSGRLAVRGFAGQIFNIGLNGVRLAVSATPTVGRITGTQFPFQLAGSVQPGNCTQPSMTTDWSFDPM